jgi:protein tyrosine/serine phosphatase
LPIIDSKLQIWRGERPTDLTGLKNLGIKRIINLESGMYELIRVYDNEFSIEQLQFPPDFGMVEYHMPVKAYSPPPVKFIYKILDLVRDGIPTYIHCKQGVDRTGFVAAVIRMQINRWPYERALTEWKQLGRHPWFFWWESELIKWDNKGEKYV